MELMEAFRDVKIRVIRVSVCPPPLVTLTGWIHTSERCDRTPHPAVTASEPPPR